MLENNQSFKILTQNKPPTPLRWLKYIALNSVLAGILFLYAYSVAWNPPSWVRSIRGDVILEVLGFILGASLLVFSLAFIVDSIRFVFYKSDKK